MRGIILRDHYPRQRSRFYRRPLWVTILEDIAYVIGFLISTGVIGFFVLLVMANIIQF